MTRTLHIFKVYHILLARIEDLGKIMVRSCQDLVGISSKNSYKMLSRSYQDFCQDLVQSKILSRSWIILPVSWQDLSKISLSWINLAKILARLSMILQDHGGSWGIFRDLAKTVDMGVAFLSRVEGRGVLRQGSRVTGRGLEKDPSSIANNLGFTSKRECNPKPEERPHAIPWSLAGVC